MPYNNRNVIDLTETPIIRNPYNLDFKDEKQLPGESDFLITEDGDFLITEDSNFLITEG